MFAKLKQRIKNKFRQDPTPFVNPEDYIDQNGDNDNANNDIIAANEEIIKDYFGNIDKCISDTMNELQQKYSDDPKRPTDADKLAAIINSCICPNLTATINENNQIVLSVKGEEIFCNPENVNNYGEILKNIQNKTNAIDTSLYLYEVINSLGCNITIVYNLLQQRMELRVDGVSVPLCTSNRIGLIDASLYFFKKTMIISNATRNTSSLIVVLLSGLALFVGIDNRYKFILNNDGSVNLTIVK
jgi:hypothetical protein